MGYAALYLIPLFCILIPLLALAVTVVVFRWVSRQRPRFRFWPLLLGLPVVGYVILMAWQMWNFFWDYMNCSSC